MIIYLIKFSACLAAFMVVYKLLLESESFHKFKRFYLLSAVILALTIPLVTFTSYIEPMPLETIPVTEVIQNQQEIPVSEYQKSNNLPIVLWSIYLIGLLVFGSKFVYNLSAIYRKIKQNPKHTSKSFIHVLLNDLIAPHTFFSYIFLNKKKYECQEIPQEVYIHEQAHAKQKHTLDILFIELMQVVFWFNPLIYFIKKDIKLNHEFLADDAVIKNGYSTAGYQKTLLAFSSHAIEPQLANAINYSSIKKRFTVMKTQTSKTTKWIKSLVLLPLLAVLIYSFSQREEVVKNHSNNGLKNELSNSYDISSKKNVVIMIQVNSVSINAKQSSIETFKDDLNTATKNWDDGDYASINPILKIASCTKEYLEKLNTEFKKTDYFKKSNQDLEITNPQQKGASKAQIVEYNKLAKHYNSQKGKNYTIKLSDMKRIKYLYDLMTEEQRKSAEPFPNFPPPPPPPPAPESVSKKERAEYESMAKKAKAGKAYSYKYKDENGKAIKVEVSERETKLPPPPPPPVPANATQEQKEKYKKTSEEYYKKYKVKNGKVERIKAPEPPAPPKSLEIIEVPMAVAQPPKAQQQYYDSLATFKYQGKLTKNKSGDTREVIEVPMSPPPPPIPANATAEQKVKYKKAIEDYAKNTLKALQKKHLNLAKLLK